MEQTPWKPILYGALFSFLMLALVYLLVLPKQAPSRKTEKILEFEGSKIIGRKEGKKVWEFFAKTGWVGNDHNTTNLENITNGTFYKDGDLTIKNFKAGKVFAHRQSKNVEAQTAIAEIAITGKKNRHKRRFMRITANQLTYNPDQKKSWLNGNIKLIDKKTSLLSQSIEIDHDKGIASLTGKISAIRSDVFLECDNLTYSADNEEILASGNVRSQINGKQKTSITSSFLSMYLDEKKEVIASGEVSAIQGKKAAAAEKAVYDENDRKITLSGGVKAIIERGIALIKEETARKLRNKEVKELLEDKTLQDSDILVLSTQNGDSLAFGNVKVMQKDREAKADQATYSDKDEIITLTNNVFMKQKKRWVKCRKVIVSVKNRTFEAIGGVQAEFRIKKNKLNN